jgi:cold shock CspA family protein
LLKIGAWNFESNLVSNAQPQDQIYYCERCGISFLWSAEEKKAPNSDGQSGADTSRPATRSAPSHCPGCRLLLPAPGRERGLVKWYNRRKRFGFLVRRDHPEIFAHGSDLKGAVALHPGDLVEFSVTESERGLAAKEITILAHGEAPTPD